jgi:predicted hydrocarbon binding protein
MFKGILTKFISFGYLKYKDGKIFFGDEKMLFVNLFPLVEQFMMHRKMNDELFDIIAYVSFKKSNQQFTRDHFQRFGKSLLSVMDISKQMFYAIGWADVEFVRYDEKENFMLIHAKKSTFAEEIKLRHGIQKDPVDFMMAGIFAGAVQVYSPKGKKIYAIEVRCKAQRDVKECEFVVASEEKIMGFLVKYGKAEQERAKKMISRIKKMEK